MSIPRIAVCQLAYQRDLDKALARAVESVRQAASRGADIAVLPEWFLGLNPVEVIPNRLTQALSRVASELGLIVVTGSVRVLDGVTIKKQQRGLVVEKDGTIVGTQSKVNFQPTERPWFEPGSGITAIHTRWGRIVILLGLDAWDQDLWHQAQALQPELVVMAASPRTVTERNHMQELAVSHSLEIQATVVVAPIIGRFSGQNYLGGALIAHQGRLLSMAGEEPVLLMADDPQAPLIQLGVTDVSSYIPQCPPPVGMTTFARKAIEPEAEKKVLCDWGALLADDVRDAGRQLLAMAQENPRWLALAPARAHQAEALNDLLESGAAGCFLYPALDRLMPYDAGIMALTSVMARFRRPVVIHTGPGPNPLRYESPLLWDEFLSAIPQCPVIFIHSGQMRPFWDEVLLLAHRHAHCYLETSLVPLDLLQEALRQLGAARLVFGSGGAESLFMDEWQKLEALKPLLSPAEWNDITGQTARNIFFESQDVRKAGKFNVIRRPG
ncbi:nitrilase-related carbon-nitrogen hydrolase [Sulfobacillus sp. hq2]|uniref:Acyltransferase n=1 Tax=Sulfobacillus thermotolerans TaxID=338644 RepID=A0ABM6RUK5_9FIRM|nr:nitrilase-related carbon-nitrogen hydrolase [Sulfobacillus sp. hq2]AUW95195.1 acyltransferase [Sulfobacillus thermotolerans]POB10149.1 acyltransferase [Sulfobacillus sp. hq2]